MSKFPVNEGKNGETITLISPNPPQGKVHNIQISIQDKEGSKSLKENSFMSNKPKKN